MGQKIQDLFWKEKLNSPNIDLFIYKGRKTLEKIDEVNPTIVIMDEYFDDEEYLESANKCDEENITYYRFSPDEDMNNNKYNLSHDILESINIGSK